MASTSSAATVLGGDDEWELCNDEGFIYKRKKRLRIEEPEPVTKTPDPELERRSRKERKRRTLLKLKREYQKEIDQWENLSNTLHEMQEKTQHQINLQQEQQEKDDTASLSNSPPREVRGGKDSGGSLVDELLLQIEAQEAIIHDVSNLCDVAEAMCNAQEQRVKQQYFNLPIWASPQELMTSLCDELIPWSLKKMVYQSQCMPLESEPKYALEPRARQCMSSRPGLPQMRGICNCSTPKQRDS